MGTSIPRGKFVLYWMTAYRRATWNYSLQRAVEWAVATGKPLLVVEVLAIGGRWGSRRHHQFVLDGMSDNAEHFARHGVAYRPFVERVAGSALEVLAALARRACVIVTDDFPEPDVDDASTAPWKKFEILVEKVDSNGLLPLRATEKSLPRRIRSAVPSSGPFGTLARSAETGSAEPGEIAAAGQLAARDCRPWGDCLGAWSQATSLLAALPVNHEVFR